MDPKDEQILISETISEHCMCNLGLHITQAAVCKSPQSFVQLHQSGTFQFYFQVKYGVHKPIKNNGANKEVEASSTKEAKNNTGSKFLALKPSSILDAF